jgi:hypothetical protein
MKCEICDVDYPEGEVSLVCDPTGEIDYAMCTKCYDKIVERQGT